MKSYTVTHRFNEKLYTEHFEFLTIAIFAVEKLLNDGYKASLHEIDSEDDKVFVMNTIERN